VGKPEALSTGSVLRGASAAAALGADGRPLRRPIVFLDTSTLCNAFPGARNPDPDLTEVVARAASRGTLCFSIAHVIELGALGPKEYALQIARWLDGIEHAWVQVTNAEEEELSHAVRAALGLTTEKPRLPVHFVITAALRDNLAAVTPFESFQILSDPTIAGCVGSAHGKMDWQKAKDFSVQNFRRLHYDRTHLPPGTTPEDVRNRGDLKFAADLKMRARAGLWNDPDVVAVATSLTDADLYAAVDRVLDDPASLPMNRIVRHVFGSVGERIGAQSADSKRFTERYSSFIWDTRHAVAAAFADVFTCDHFAEEILGDYRTARGLPRQLSIGGNVDRVAFAAALRQQIER
jgi:hypothetical protein